MLWFYGNYKHFYFYSARIDFRRRNLTSPDVRFRHLMSILALSGCSSALPLFSIIRMWAYIIFHHVPVCLTCVFSLSVLTWECLTSLGTPVSAIMTTITFMDMYERLKIDRTQRRKMKIRQLVMLAASHRMESQSLYPQKV